MHGERGDARWHRVHAGKFPGLSPLVCCTTAPGTRKQCHVTVIDGLERRRNVAGSAGGGAMAARRSDSALDGPASAGAHGTDLATGEPSGKSGDSHLGDATRRKGGRDSVPLSEGAKPHYPRLFGSRIEARAVAFVGMFFVTLTAASLYSLLAPFFPTVAGAYSDADPPPAQGAGFSLLLPQRCQSAASRWAHAKQLYHWLPSTCAAYLPRGVARTRSWAICLGRCALATPPLLCVTDPCLLTHCPPTLSTLPDTQRKRECTPPL